jgi:hypothetical protein
MLNYVKYKISWAVHKFVRTLMLIFKKKNMLNKNYRRVQLVILK